MKYFIFFCLLISLISCKKMIKVSPTEYIESNTALDTKDNIEAASYGVYAILRDVNLYGRDLVVFGDALADNTVHTNVSTTLANVYNNVTGAHYVNWTPAFYGINRANLVLDALQKINAEEAWKDKIGGSVLFLRALLYFDLARVYGYDPTSVIASNDRGAVPLQTKGVISVDEIEILPRNSIMETYDFIYHDLDSATAKISRIGGGSTNNHQVSLDAINALYSRVALYRGDYEKCIRKSTEAINGKVGILTNINNYISGWRAETHPESIFELKINVNENIGANNSVRATYTTRAFLESQEPSTHGLLAVGDDLYSQYENADIRKNLIIKGLGNNINRNEITKFISKGGVKDLDNIPIIRMSEIYLNRAESYYQLSLQDSALQDLNTIRTNRGLNAVSITNTSLYEEILKQERLEFAFEGHRWFDLKRLGRNIVKNGITLSSSSFKILSLIPYSEVNASKGIILQNRGY